MKSHSRLSVDGEVVDYPEITSPSNSGTFSLPLHLLSMEMDDRLFTATSKHCKQPKNTVLKVLLLYFLSLVVQAFFQSLSSALH